MQSNYAEKSKNEGACCILIFACSVFLAIVGKFVLHFVLHSVLKWWKTEPIFVLNYNLWNSRSLVFAAFSTETAVYGHCLVDAPIGFDSRLLHSKMPINAASFSFGLHKFPSAASYASHCLAESQWYSALGKWISCLKEKNAIQVGRVKLLYGNFPIWKDESTRWVGNLKRHSEKIPI